MKRLFTATVVVVVATVGIFAVAFNQPRTESNHAIHQQTQTAFMVADGAADPGKIPDDAAYELVFRLLISPNKSDLDRARKAAYLRFHGYSDAESAILSAAAYEFGRLIKPLDDQVMRIKDASWPNPSIAVMAQLTELENQKDAIIYELAASLDRDLSQYDGTRIGKHISAVKRHTKAFREELPKKQAGVLRRVLRSFVVQAAPQAPGCNSNAYVSSETFYDLQQLFVWTEGSFTTDYNNCGHEYTPTTTLQGPGGYSAPPGDYGAGISLQRGPGDLVDGTFFAQTNVEGYCPIAFAFYPAGGNSSQATVPGYIRVNGFGNFNPSVISVTVGTSDIPLSLTASANASAQVTIEPSYVPKSGSPPMTIASGCPQGCTFQMNGGQTVSRTIRYDPQSITTNPTEITAFAHVIASGGTTNVINNDRESTSVLTINQ